MIRVILFIAIAFSASKLEDLFKRASKWRVGNAVREVEVARDTIKNLGDSAILYLLKKHIRTDKTLELRALKSIMKDKHRSYMNVLRDSILAKNETVKIAAIYLAGELKDTQSVDYIKKTLKDTSRRVLLNALLSLGKIKDTTSGPFICNELKKHDEKTLVVALESLSKMQYTGCIKRIIPLLNSTKYKSVVKYAAIFALSYMGKKAFTSLVKKNKNSMSFYNLYAFLELIKRDTSLSLKDSIVARTIFKKAYESEDVSYRVLAVRGLCRAIPNDDKAVFKDLILYEPDRNVRFEIEKCLRK